VERKRRRKWVRNIESVLACAESNRRDSRGRKRKKSREEKSMPWMRWTPLSQLKLGRGARQTD